MRRLIWYDDRCRLADLEQQKTMAKRRTERLNQWLMWADFRTDRKMDLPQVSLSLPMSL